MSDERDDIRRMAEEVAASMTTEQQEAYIKRIDDAAKLIVATADQIFPHSNRSRRDRHPERAGVHAD